MSTSPWSNISLPQELLQIPGMLSQEEKQYLIWLTSQEYAGWGAIVDLGCWLGSSSAALAEGLKRAQRTERVQSRDLFEWRPSYMERIYAAGLPDGADFQGLFEQFTVDYREQISCKQADLLNFVWDGGPVEILFIDVAKSWQLTNKVFESFGPWIVPQRTRLVFQDFRHFSTTWLPLIIDSRPDLWEELESVEDGWTVTFLASQDVLGPNGMQLPYSAAAFDFKTAERIFKGRIESAGPPARQFYQLGLCGIALAAGRIEVAEEMMRAAQPHVRDFDRIYNTLLRNARPSNLAALSV